MADNRKISGFKKFTEMKSEKDDLKEVNLGAQPVTDSDRPGNPNLPNSSKKSKKYHQEKVLYQKIKMLT